MPTTAELIQLRDMLLAHAIGPRAARQRCALGFIIDQVIARGDKRIPIQGAEIDTKCPSDPRYPKPAVSGLIRDIGYRLKDFFDNHEASRQLPYRLEFHGDGNYYPSFPQNFPKSQERDLVPLFWKPYFPGTGNAVILYPEPQFLIDEQGTYFRNPSVGTTANKAALDYLHIPGPLKMSYSYVPSGIVQAILYLTKKLRFYEHEDAEFPSCYPVKPSVSIPPHEKNLIVLATPTSSKLVDTFQTAMPMKVSQSGVTVVNDSKTYQDNDSVKWGVLTRKPHRHRIVTMLAAQHGRSVEAIAEFLTLHDQIATLAKKLERVSQFPESFQALFRMSMANTEDGPSIEHTRVEKAIIHDQDEAQPEQSINAHPSQA